LRCLSSCLLLRLLLLRLPPPRSCLFPYTTLFRSALAAASCNEPGQECVGSDAGRRSAARHTAFAVAGYRAHGGGGHGARHSQDRSEEHTSELQSRENIVCRLLLE